MAPKLLNIIDHIYKYRETKIDSIRDEKDRAMQKM